MLKTHFESDQPTKRKHSILPRKVVSVSDVVNRSEADDGSFRVVAPDIKPDDALLIGEYRSVRLRPGLFLHATDTTDIYDLRTEAVQPPGLTISLFVQGHVNMWLGGRSFEMGLRDDRRRQTEIKAVVISKARREHFTRQSSRGMRIRKVNVTVTPEWLDDCLTSVSNYQPVVTFGKNHLASTRWTASLRLKLLAEQLIRAPSTNSILHNLYCESRSIELVCEALTTLSDGQGTEARSIHPVHLRRVQRACDFIEDHLRDDLSLHMIAQAAGLNPNSLQREFRTVKGTTIFEYVRGRKLDRAREALEHDHMSVGEAAYLAGYTSSANFATAFRKRFGVSPKYLRYR